MKLVTYSVGTGMPEAGVVEGEEIRPLGHESMIDFISHGGSPEPGEDVLRIEDARLNAPVPNPQKFI